MLLVTDSRDGAHLHYQAEEPQLSQDVSMVMWPARLIQDSETFIGIKN